jgi:excisionase family DNA binding protein
MKATTGGLMTIDQAATYLAVSRMSIYRLMRAGDLTSIKIGRRVRLHKRAVELLAARGLQRA